ncbi:hypothetical protein PT277_05150 [Acetobacteraceae bacterium ESL0709]|nr:hypothetical protein [Acetobacteraceae bacterium ESL0697]MDF7678082.1 hypothetical protein [Acetobacteraceae bacterium ESL0709]
MTDTNLTTDTHENAPLATNLVAAGENLFKSLMGREMNQNQQKISNGITQLIDGFMPTLEQMTTFDLGDLIDGMTQTLDGLAKTINSARGKPVESETSEPKNSHNE